MTLAGHGTGPSRVSILQLSQVRVGERFQHSHGRRGLRLRLSKLVLAQQTHRQRAPHRRRIPPVAELLEDLERTRQVAARLLQPRFHHVYLRHAMQ